MQDRERFLSGLLQVCTVYGRDMETVLIDAWWGACNALSDDQFAQGIEDALKESQRMPTPAQVRALAYHQHEERQQRYGSESGIPGVPLLQAGDAVDIAKREGAKYASAYLVEAGLVVPLFSCRRCRDRNYLRPEVTFGTPHFGKSIPCPDCRGEAYDRYVTKFGLPPGYPKWSGGTV
jgi:hypothetical protein